MNLQYALLFWVLATAVVASLDIKKIISSPPFFYVAGALAAVISMTIILKG